jgi:hypothetical protein
MLVHRNALKTPARRCGGKQATVLMGNPRVHGYCFVGVGARFFLQALTPWAKICRHRFEALACAAAWRRTSHTLAAWTSALAWNVSVEPPCSWHGAFREPRSSVRDHEAIGVNQIIDMTLCPSG